MSNKKTIASDAKSGVGMPLRHLPTVVGVGALVFASVWSLLPLDYGDIRTVYVTNAGVSVAILAVQLTATALMTTVQAEKYLRWLAVGNHLKPMYMVFVNSMWWSGMWCGVSLLAMVNTHVHVFTVIVPIIAAMSFAYTARVIKMLSIVGELIFNRIQTEAWAAAESKRLEMDEKIGPPGSF